MKTSHTLFLMTMPLSVIAHNLFRVAPQAATSLSSFYRLQPTEVPGGFDPTELLDSRSGKPEIFNQAMVELKQLESKPICHRVAARLLVNNCRGLEQLNEHNFQFNSNEAQRHHVDSFTISLTTCELERMALDIPSECSPFTSIALFQYARDGHEKLEVSAAQVNECLRALAQDHSSLQTWISYRDKALIFCQAARLDLDKDQAIRLNRKLTEIMEDFISKAQEKLESVMRSMVENEEAAESFFKNAMSDAENWRFEVQDSFKSVANGAKEIDSTMKSILSSSNDITKMLKSFMRITFESTASIANEHEKALDVTTNGFKTRMANIHATVAEAEGKLSEMKALIVEAISPMMVSLLDRQDDLEKRTQNVLSAVINATELLQSHNQKLDQATSKTSKITDDLKNAAAAARSWSENMSVGGAVPGWAIKMISIFGSLAVGNLGGPPTLTRSVALLAAGILTGEAAIQARSLWASIQILTVFSDCFLWASKIYSPVAAISTAQQPNITSNDSECHDATQFNVT